jgi:hypothetical protein
MKVTKAKRVRRVFEDRRHTRDQENTGGHHGGGVDERRDRCRAFHRVRQPGVQQELRRFTHRAHEQQQTDRGQRMHFHAEEVERGIGILSGGFENHIELCRAEQDEHAEDAEQVAEVADTVDDERLHGR